MAKSVTPARGFNKTATVTIRLSPKHRFALDLLARTKRQTVSSVIEELIRDRVGEALTAIDPKPQGRPEKFAKALLGAGELGDLLLHVWDPREPDRFVNLAMAAPGLLTEEEEFLWRLIQESPLWRKGEPDRERLRQHWPAVQRAAARGAASLTPFIDKE
jgi:hypothetical protein